MNEPIVLSLGPIAANCYLVPDGAGRCAVVDPGDAADAIESRLGAENLTPAVVLLTHGHFDHIGAAKELRAAHGCPIVIGEPDAELLENPELSLAGRGERYRFSPDRTVVDGDVVEAGELRFTVIATPGHTRGGVCYRCENQLYCGDTLFLNDCGRTDLYGGDWAVLQRSLQKLKALAGEPENVLVYPGHGPATDIRSEAARNPTMNPPDDDALY